MRVWKFGGSSLADGERIGRAADLVRKAGIIPVVVVSAPGGVTNLLVDLCNRADLRLAGRDALSEGHSGSEAAREDDWKALGRRLGEMVESAGVAAEARDGLLDRLSTVLERASALLAATAPASKGDAARRDAVLATGEDLSAELMAEALKGRGVPARLVDARTLLRTDDRYGRAVLLEEATTEQVRERLLPLLREGVVPVVQGFLGATVEGATTTLGRGGGDYSAAILGAALGAERVDIWTDVDGIFSADPRKVPGARILPEVGYEEAVELAHFGARVIHPGAAKHAVSRGVPVRVRNTFRPERAGTSIRMDRRGTASVAAVAAKHGTILIKVRAFPSSIPYGFLARVFGVLTRHEVPADLVATSHSSTAFTLDEHEELGAVADELSDFAEVEVVRALATLTVVGSGLLAEPGLAGRVFWVVGKTPVHLISQASDVSLSFLVEAREADEVVRRLHEMLIEWPEKGEEPQ